MFDITNDANGKKTQDTKRVNEISEISKLFIAWTQAWTLSFTSFQVTVGPHAVICRFTAVVREILKYDYCFEVFVELT